MQKGSTVFKEHGNMLAIKYRGAKDKTAGKPKIVHVILTKHSARMVNTCKVQNVHHTKYKGVEWVGCVTSPMILL